MPIHVLDPVRDLALIKKLELVKIEVTFPQNAERKVTVGQRVPNGKRFTVGEIHHETQAENDQQLSRVERFAQPEFVREDDAEKNQGQQADDG